ncbi:DUF6461 domain-containing protein [Streptosporangium sp. OZ121]|uniref:DUF6461 domain-containing protein n=1 Tax=Streptosporangium sp. OZ121 TaxID=3444183 RepID=UPI003F78B219
MQSPTYLHDLLVSTLFTEGLDADPDLWQLGFSAIWIKGADLDSLARDFSLDLATHTPCHLSEILDYHGDDESSWVAEVEDWVAIVPAHGHSEFLRSITEGGRQALGLRLDINGNAYFDYARDGHMIVSFDPTRPQERSGDDPHALDHLTDGLRFQTGDDDVLDDPVEAPESVSSALALIGRFTETDIATDWFLAQHSRIRPTS